MSWDEALELDRRADAAREGRRRARESILPYSYGGSNGLLTQDNLDATLWRRFGTSRLARTVCAAPTGAANMALYGKMPSVTYQDYPDARLIVLWGVNPSASGIHLVPYVREAQKRGAKLVVDRSARRRRWPRRRRAPRGQARHRRRRRARDPPVSVRERRTPTTAFLREHTRERRAAARAGRAVDDRARGGGRRRRRRRRSSALRALYAQTSPALIRCGWGLERNRNGGNAAMAVLALPAVGGKFGVRGGGYSMSNSASWGIERTWIGAPEPDTRLVNMNHLGRALLEYHDPPVKVLFVYNCNPAATVPDQQPRACAACEREDLFTVVFEQVMTDTALYADVVLPATTFLEGYDFAKAYGPINLDLGRPVIDAGRRSAVERRRVRRAVRAAGPARRTTSRPASSTCW